jgi:hypothetical protein
MATTKTLPPISQTGPDALNGAAGAALLKNIVREAEEIERDCRIAVQCHGAAATKWGRVYYLLGLPTTMLAALAGITALNDQPALAAFLAIGATISAAVNTFLNAGQTTTAHAKKRSEYEQLKNEIRHFRTITLETNRPVRELIRELTRYSARRDVINLEAPQVASRVHATATAQLAPKEGG